MSNTLHARLPHGHRVARHSKEKGELYLCIGTIGSLWWAASSHAHLRSDNAAA